MRKVVSQEKTLFLRIVEHENFSVMFKISQFACGEKSMLVFFVNGEWRLHIHEVSSLEEAQNVLGSPSFRAVLDMSDEDASAIYAKLPLLFVRENYSESEADNPN